MYTEREFSKSNTFDFSFLLFSYFCQQSVILNFKAASGIFKKGHLWHSLTQKCLKITLFLEKRALFLSNITRGSVQLPDADFFWIIL